MSLRASYYGNLTKRLYVVDVLVQAQASFLAYMDAFWVLMLVALAAVPLGLSLNKKLS
jgi:hypothetical protein